jgi:hypothetical protein
MRVEPDEKFIEALDRELRIFNYFIDRVMEKIHATNDLPIPPSRFALKAALRASVEMVPGFAIPYHHCAVSVQRHRCSPASDRKEPPLDLTQLEDEMHDRLMRFKNTAPVARQGNHVCTVSGSMIAIFSRPCK